MRDCGTVSRVPGASDAPAAPGGPEVWVGLECTINRVENRWHDQLAIAGHYARVEADIDRIADLGVRTVRYPILWERHAEGDGAAWAVTDRALVRMRARGIDPIIGLVHHGSGPPGARIDDGTFADGLAAFARTVARRHPWVRRYTPINEPLTTARFALLYGVWHPHLRDDIAFARGMLVQADATGRAMRAIRAVRRDAELVQTEDLGHTHATPPLQYQADFENARRWLTFDLLEGNVGPSHPLWSYLGRSRGGHEALRRLADDPSPPDVIGLNHYVTSERFLDHRLARYPTHTHGGNGRDRYADVEAVRALHHDVVGPYRLLREAWERFRRPIALTEAHLGCSREQQLCWLADLVRAAHELHGEGVDIRAVTAWAAFGSFDWPSLLTRADGVYESGIFDLRSPEPRATALASMIRALASGSPYDHPVLDSPGWWQCDQRLTFHDQVERGASLPVVLERASRPHDSTSPADVAARAARGPVPLGSARGEARRILVTGSNGTLGRALIEACRERHLAVIGLPRSALDIADAKQVAAVFDEVRPWAVVNAAGYVRVDDAERDRERCRWTNTIGPAVLADRCVTRNIAMVTLSTDLVFDGSKEEPYVESDAVAPLNTYGRSKAEAERLVREILPSTLIVRTSAFFGEGDDHNFLTRTLASLAMGKRVRVAADAVVSPTYVPDLVHAMLDLLIDGEMGTWHLANAGAVTWLELARRAARLARLPLDRLQGVPTSDLTLHAARPLRSALASERGALLPPLDVALGRYVQQRPWERLARRGRPRDGTATPTDGVMPFAASGGEGSA